MIIIISSKQDWQYMQHNKENKYKQKTVIKHMNCIVSADT